MSCFRLSTSGRTSALDAPVTTLTQSSERFAVATGSVRMGGFLPSTSAIMRSISAYVITSSQPMS